MTRPFAVMLGVVLLGAGCGGGTGADGLGDRVQAADAETPIEDLASPPPVDGAEPAAPGEPSADTAGAGPPDDPPQPAGTADVGESAEEIASAPGGPDERRAQGEQAMSATGETEPTGEPPTVADSGALAGGGGSTGEAPPAGGTGSVGEPGAVTGTGAQEGEDAAAAERPSAGTAQDPEPPAEADSAGETEPAGEPGSANDPDTAAEGPEPVAEPADTSSGVAFADCGQVYLCTTLAVPADHDDPGGVTVDLAVGMLPAGDASRRIGYLLVNPGGPGGGMHDFLNAGAGLSADVLDRFDVIGWDPRGVGGSVPSGCSAEARGLYLLDPVPDTPGERDALDGAARALAEACAGNLGDLVGHIGTIHTVRDMDAIRRALGAETISFLGFSYGTRLGLHYADMFGEHLRAAVLDGVIDPSLPGAELAVGQMVGFARTIDEMFAWCRSDPGCAVTDDPEATYDRLLAQVDVAPSVDLAGRVVLDPARAILAVVVASYSSDSWPFFFDALAAAVDGDGTMFGLLGEAFVGIADLGAFISISCTDGGAARRQDLDVLAEALAEVAGDFGRSAAVSGLPCEYWPVSAGTLPVGAIAAPDAPPILVVGNRGDNATPYEWAAAVARQLASGVLVSYDGNEHTSYGLSACVDRVVDDYLIDGVVPAADVDCPAEG